jgi:predicted O-methyltransferase YrrM
MTVPATLTTAPVAPLLKRLFAEADASTARLNTQITDISDAEFAELMGSKTAYRAFYGRVKDAHLAVSPEAGRLLYMLARSTSARHIVEFGTSFGISTLHLAAALRDNGGGRLIGSEFEPSKVAAARANIAAAGLDDLVEIREGDALETLAHNLPTEIDLVLLDGAKGLYPEILKLVEPRLRRGALVLADNVKWSPDYVARVRSADQGYLSVTFAEDMEISMRIG